ncbi:MAG TPA: hypothetical protein VIV60_28920 [Polyangiaceae bacterium]
MSQFYTSTRNHERDDSKLPRVGRALGVAVLGVILFGATGCAGEDVAATNRLGEAQGAASNPTDVAIQTDKIRTFDCGDVSIAMSEQGFATFIFNGGDAPERRLWADAKDTAPACIIAIPMTIPSGKKLTPTTLNLRGVAHQSRLTTYYYWRSGEVTDRPSTGLGLSNAYSFEKDLPVDRSTEVMKSFNFREPLQDLDSPTCSSQAAHLVTLVVTLQRFVDNPHSHASDPGQSYSDALLAVDSVDVGLGLLDSCGTKPGDQQSVGADEKCGWIDSKWINCKDTSKHVCVTSFTEQILPDNPNEVDTNTPPLESGTCVDISSTSKDRPTNLESGFEDECAGPFHMRCKSTDSQELVCRFKNRHAAESNDHYLGMCLEAIGEGETCHPELFRGCNQYECNARVNPCKSGLECKNSVCVSKTR